MLNDQQEFGRQGEVYALKYLVAEGYEILEQNYRSKFGEIDIIALDSGSIVFIEVKSRKRGTYGSAKQAITYAKQKKLSKTALYYLKTTKQFHMKARFDVVAIDIHQGNMKIDILKNAFNLAYK